MLRSVLRSGGMILGLEDLEEGSREGGMWLALLADKKIQGGERMV